MTTRFADHLLAGDHASRPAAGDVPEGTLYACSTHGAIDQSDGASSWSTWLAAPVSVSDPVADLFGTPDTTFEFDTSSFTGLTAAGSPDVEDADTTFDSHYYFKDNDSTLVGRYTSGLSTPFTVVAKLSDAVLDANYKYAHLFVGVSSPGKLVSLGPVYSDGSKFAGRVWTSFTDGGPAGWTPTVTPWDPTGFAPWYIGAKVSSSTDVSWYYSRDGKRWFLAAASRNDSLTIASAGIVGGDYGGTTSGAQAAWDYLRIWNSAKTFPAFT